MKELFTEQFLLLQLDEERAVRTLPGLMPVEAAQRRALLAELKRVVGASGRLAEEGGRRLARVETLFRGKEAAHPKDEALSKHDHAA